MEGLLAVVSSGRNLAEPSRGSGREQARVVFSPRPFDVGMG
jgi:hypothetical protein